MSESHSERLYFQRLERSGDYALFIMKSLFVLNSGAIIATLAFVGNASEKMPGDSAPTLLSYAFGSFVAGVVAALASAMAFVIFHEVQFKKSSVTSGSPKLGQITKPMAALGLSSYVFVFVSLGAFIIGSYFEMKLIQKMVAG